MTATFNEDQIYGHRKGGVLYGPAFFRSVRDKSRTNGSGTGRQIRIAVSLRPCRHMMSAFNIADPIPLGRQLFDDLCNQVCFSRTRSFCSDGNDRNGAILINCTSQGFFIGYGCVHIQVLACIRRFVDENRLFIINFSNFVVVGGQGCTDFFINPSLIKCRQGIFSPVDNGYNSVILGGIGSQQSRHP